MKRMVRLLGAAALLAISSASGCVSTSFTASRSQDGTSLHNVAPETVKLLTAAPTTAFRTLGEIEADISGFPSDETVLKHVRERAASVGANAVIYAGTGHAFMANTGFLTDTARPATITFTAVRLPE